MNKEIKNIKLEFEKGCDKIMKKHMKQIEKEITELRIKLVNNGLGRSYGYEKAKEGLKKLEKCNYYKEDKKDLSRLRNRK